MSAQGGFPWQRKIKGQQLSGSSERARCRRGRSEIPHFPSKLQSFALVPGEKRSKTKNGVSQSVRETSRDESQVFPPQRNSSKRGIWSSQFFRDLSQVVGRTPRDTPVPSYTNTSPFPISSREKLKGNS